MLLEFGEWLSKLIRFLIGIKGHCTNIGIRKKSALSFVTLILAISHFGASVEALKKFPFWFSLK